MKTASQRTQRISANINLALETLMSCDRHDRCGVIEE